MMTLKQLRQRGWASDEQLRATYRELHQGREPAWIVTGADWTRQLTFNAVQAKLAGRKARLLEGVPAIGNHHSLRDEE